MFFRNFIQKDTPVLIFGPSTFVDRPVLKRMDQIKELKVNFWGQIIWPGWSGWPRCTSDFRIKMDVSRPKMHNLFKDKNKRLSDAFVTTGLVLKSLKENLRHSKCSTTAPPTSKSLKYHVFRKIFFQPKSFFYLITSHFCDDFEIAFRALFCRFRSKMALQAITFGTKIISTDR